MTAFARAVAALHRDPNLSVACVWVPSGGTEEDDGIACRGVLSQPADRAFGAGTPGAVAGTLDIDIAVADVATIAREDRVVIDGASRKVEQAERDVEGLTWRVTLSIAD